MAELPSLVKTLDLFGTTFNFTDNKNKKFHTKFSLFLSFVVYTLIGVFIGVFGLDMFNRTNPKVLFQQVQLKNYSEQVPSMRNFTFAWTLEGDFGYWNLTNRLYPKITHLRMERDSTGTLQIVSERLLELTFCSNETVEDPRFINNFKLDNWYCLNFQQQNVSVGGFWDTTTFLNHLTIEVFFCPDNNSTHPNCTPIEQIKEFTLVEKLYFSYIIPQFYLDVNNLENPLRYDYITGYNTVNMNLIRTDSLHMKTIEAQDDQNLIRTEFKNHSQLVMNKLDQLIAFKDTNDYYNKNLGTDLYAFAIYYSKNRDLYIRTFMKIQDLAALVGGILSIIMTIGKILSSYYNTYSRYINLINNIFEYEETANANKDLNELKISNILNVSDPICMVSSNTRPKEIPIQKHKPYLDNSSCNNIKPLEQMRRGDAEKMKKEEDFLEIRKYNDNKSDFEKMNEYGVLRVEGHEMEEKVETSNSLLKKRKTVLYKLSEQRENTLKSKLNENKKLIEERKEKNWLSLEFCLLIKRILFRSNLTENQRKRIKVYDMAVDYVTSKLDITNYINMFQTIDKIKFITYNESQVIGLNYSKKPNLNDPEELRLFDINPDRYSSNDESQENKLAKQLYLREYEQEEQLHVIKYLLYSLKTKQLDKIDQKIYDTLEPGLKKLIDSELNENMQ